MNVGNYDLSDAAAAAAATTQNTFATTTASNIPKIIGLSFAVSSNSISKIVHRYQVKAIMNIHGLSVFWY